MLSVYMAHRGELVAYASGIVGDRSRAEDVVQEAWLRFSAVVDGRILDEPIGYLYRIVRNLAVDGRRRMIREARVLDPCTDSVFLRAADDRPGPEAEAVANSDLALLAQAMAELPERTRIALEMRRHGGFKLREIADHLGVSVTLAHTIVAEGIDYCRDRMARAS